jgi:hypothetical protein
VTATRASERRCFLEVIRVMFRQIGVGPRVLHRLTLHAK